MRRFAALSPLLLLTVGFSARPSFALEMPIGKPQIHAGMEVAAVYLQPVKMDPEGTMRRAEDSDVHMEIDIRAQKDNPNGFADGSFVPYLSVKYELARQGSSQKIAGDMMPMVASDGPHYGDNIKLAGPGKYTLKVAVAPPSEPSRFGRHTDKETGVGAWFKPFTLTYDFVFAGVGKKGGY